MKPNFYTKCLFLIVALILTATNLNAQVPTISGPVDPATGMPATLADGPTPGQVYTTEKGMTNYTWTVSSGGKIVSPQPWSNSIIVDWTIDVPLTGGQQTLSVSYTNKNAGNVSAVLVINYFPFAGPIDPATIPQFVDPMPHFAAGLRVNARAGGNLFVKATLTRQVALSTGTVLSTGTIGPAAPTVGLGNYAGYSISKDGVDYGPKMWPAQTIETQQGNELKVQYINELNGVRYKDFNILADQTLMMNGYVLTGNALTDPYTGPIPMVTHLHGGEMPSGSDGGPNAWFMPPGDAVGFNEFGPGFLHNASTLATYPNMQEATTLWFHPHDDGLTRINVYTGLAGYYLIRGEDEETAKFPGWSGDDKVREVTPAGKTATFNGTNTYLPEVEIAIQDRMFNVRGELYWPVAPPNPEIHPFWTPEFVGDIITVNGKSWPYLSVAPRKYRFRMLEGCNARFLNMWLVNSKNGQPGPVITVIGGEGGLLAAPVILNPALGQTLLMAPGQRYDVVIDFTGIPLGTTFTLMNNAGTPYPFGAPVVPGTTDRIMQFVVNGQMVSSANPAATGTDKSLVPFNLRPANSLVALTDFNGTSLVTADVNREIILNEVMSVGGPASVLVNNSYFEETLAIPGTTLPVAGGPTEILEEGTTEIVKIINVSADAHPIHIHLLQWQLVSRQAINDIGYLAAYSAAWTAAGGTSFPPGQGYPGGAGPPFNYNTNTANPGVLGGNPPLTGFLVGPVIPANPEERGWKDNVIVMPGEVTTFITRVAPTDKPINSIKSDLIFPFDPGFGPGYVWHCHIVDHEDMSMMRPLMITPTTRPSTISITEQPVNVPACNGDVVTFSVKATSAYLISYQWQYWDGVAWVNLAESTPGTPTPYSGTQTRLLKINTAVAGFAPASYKCFLTNGADFLALPKFGITSDQALLTVNNCFVSGTISYNNSAKTPMAGFQISVDNKNSDVTDGTGLYQIKGVTSGIHPVTLTATPTAGGINSADAGKVNSWVMAPVAVPPVTYLSGDVDNTLSITALDAQSIQNNFVNAAPFVKPPWVLWFSSLIGITVNPDPLTVNVNGSSKSGFDISVLSTGDFNSSFVVAGGNSNVDLKKSGTILPVAPGKQFDLALKAGSNMTVGAVSLILTVPSNLVSVTNVKVQGSNVPVTWKWDAASNVLRIGWNSTTPVTVNMGNPLITLSLLPGIGFTTDQILGLTLKNDYLNELTDGNFAQIPGASLTVDDVITSINASNSLKLSAFPNPTLATTLITYVLPVAGNVNLGLYTAVGTLEQQLVNLTNQPIGTYTVRLDMTNKARGSYYLRITLISGKKTLTNTIIIIKP